MILIEELSSDVSSEISEIFLWKFVFFFCFFLDKEGFLNFLDVSMIRESKVEIICVYEDLKVKIFVIKDVLSWFLIYVGDENVEVEFELDGKINEFGVNFLVDIFKSGFVLFWFCRVERVKLLSLFFCLKEELVWERKMSNDGLSEGNDFCILYDNLESKLLWFLCEFVFREDEIIILVI